MRAHPADEAASTAEGQRSKSLATSSCDKRFWAPQPSPKTTTVALALGSLISVQHKGCSTDNKTKYSSIAQSVEQRTVNPWVVGSSPTWGATNPVHVCGRDFYFLLLTSSLLPQTKFFTGFLGSNK